MGTAKLLDTPCGKIAQALCKDGIIIGMSTRGLGTMSQNGDVNKDYTIAAIDCCADPSAPKAFVEAVLENKEWIQDGNGNFVEKAIEQMQESADKKFDSAAARDIMLEFVGAIRNNIKTRSMI
jgi:hypothetical protein